MSKEAVTEAVVVAETADEAAAEATVEAVVEELAAEPAVDEMEEVADEAGEIDAPLTVIDMSDLVGRGGTQSKPDVRPVIPEEAPAARESCECGWSRFMLEAAD